MVFVHINTSRPVLRKQKKYPDKPEEVRCNKCGKKMDAIDKQQNFTYDSMISYGSAYDGSWVRLRLCCKCIDNLLAECEVNPFVH